MKGTENEVNLFWLVGFLILGFIGLCSLIVALLAKDPQDSEARGWAIGIAILIAVVNVGWTGLSMIHIIEAQEVGVVRTFGKITGQVPEGFQLTAPWQNVEKWNIRTQTIEPGTTCSNGAQKCMDAASVDVQDVYVSGTLNIRVATGDVQELARSVGQGYREAIVLNRLSQVVKETTATYKAEDIIANRENIRQTIRERMIEELSPFSINVLDFLITNIDFTPAFKESIEGKVVAEQTAAQERNKVEIAKAQADQKIETARGAAEVLIEEARGQAEANRQITASLTPELIQWQAIQKLQDNITIALVPDNGTILQLPSSIFQGGQ